MERSVLPCACNKKIAEVYCEDHCLILCLTCMEAKHGQCNKSSIEEKNASFSTEEITLTMLALQRLKERLVTLQKDGELKSEQLETMEQNCKEQIKQLRKQLNAYLDIIEENTLSELNKWKQVLTEDIGSQNKVLRDTLEATDANKNLLQDTLEKGVKQDMFAANTKVHSSIKRHTRRIHKMSSELFSPLLKFEVNEKWAKIQEGIHRLGNIKTNCRTAQVPVENREVELFTTVDTVLPTDTAVPFISSSAFLASGELVLCDRSNSCVKLLDCDLENVEKIPLSNFPVDVAAIDTSGVVVTVPEKKQLQYVTVLPHLQLGQHVQLDKSCWGVTVAGETIYVTVYTRSVSYHPDDSEVRVLRKTGEQIRSIPVHSMGGVSRPYFIAANSNSGDLYISDFSVSGVLCLTYDDHLTHKYHSHYLQDPRGLAVDDDNNLFICGYGSSNIHVASCSGKNLHIFLRFYKDKKPYSFAYWKSDHAFAIGFYKMKELYVYKFK